MTPKGVLNGRGVKEKNGGNNSLPQGFLANSAIFFGGGVVCSKDDTVWGSEAHRHGMNHSKVCTMRREMMLLLLLLMLLLQYKPMYHCDVSPTTSE